MKRVLLVISCLMFSFGWIMGNAVPTLKSANDMYIKGQYAEAARQYESILQHKGVAPELYLNLGNAYFKQNEIAKSILNYERALRLDPHMDDAKINLEVVQQKVVDNIPANSSFFLGRWLAWIIKLFSSNTWLFVSLLFFVVSLLFVFVFVFGPSLFLRKASFYAAVVVFILSVSFLTFSGIRKSQTVGHHEAIVMTGVVSVKSSPDKSGTDLFQLHEGTKVSIKSTLGNWVEIVLGNGNVGWLEKENIETI